MRNVVLKKEMKFPNAKVFRAALREPRYQFTVRMSVGGDVMHLK